MNAANIKYKFQDYLELKKALDNLEEKVITAFCYDNESEAFDNIGKEFQKLFEVFSDKLLIKYVQIIRETLDDELV